MIPKVIHYCWFGGKVKPKLVQNCLNSWKKYLPDFEVKEWNEMNSDLSHPFVRKALQMKKWAFVSDYVRLNVLSEHGGIYLDTDMMLLKNLNPLLTNQCFFGAEDKEFISCGIIGCIANYKFIEECKLIYDEILDLENLVNITIPRLITQKFRELYKFDAEFGFLTTIEDIKIYPKEYFYPLPFKNKYDSENYKSYITIDSYAVHLWNSSWIEYSEFHYFRDAQYSKGFQKVLDKIIRERKVHLKYLRKVASAIRESYKIKR